MSRYAVVEDDVVTNVILLDDVGDYVGDEELIPLVDNNVSVSIGWVRLSGVWSDPTPPQEVGPDPEVIEAQELLRQSGIDKLMALDLTEDEARAIAGV